MWHDVLNSFIMYFYSICILVVNYQRRQLDKLSPIVLTYHHVNVASWMTTHYQYKYAWNGTMNEQNEIPYWLIKWCSTLYILYHGFISLDCVCLVKLERCKQSYIVHVHTSLSWVVRFLRNSTACIICSTFLFLIYTYSNYTVVFLWFISIGNVINWERHFLFKH